MCYGEKWYVMHKSELGWSIFIDRSHSLKDGKVKKRGVLITFFRWKELSQCLIDHGDLETWFTSFKHGCSVEEFG